MLHQVLIWSYNNIYQHLLADQQNYLASFKDQWQSKEEIIILQDQMIVRLELTQILQKQSIWSLVHYSQNSTLILNSNQKYKQHLFKVNLLQRISRIGRLNNLSKTFKLYCKEYCKVSLLLRTIKEQQFNSTFKFLSWIQILFNHC